MVPPRPWCWFGYGVRAYSELGLHARKWTDTNVQFPTAIGVIIWMKSQAVARTGVDQHMRLGRVSWSFFDRSKPANRLWHRSNLCRKTAQGMLPPLETPEVRFSISWASYARNPHRDNFLHRLAPASLVSPMGKPANRHRLEDSLPGFEMPIIVKA